MEDRMTTNEIWNFVTTNAAWAHQSIQTVPVAGDAYKFMGTYFVTPVLEGSTHVIDNYAAPFFKNTAIPFAKEHKYVVGGALSLLPLFAIYAYVSYRPKKPSNT
jgi:hypothetical protein